MEKLNNQKVKVSKIGIWDILIAIVANILDQASSIKKKNRSYLFRSHSIKVLSSVWFIWFIVVFTAGMVYKGVIFSFITKPMDPQLPETLDDLVSMPLTLVKHAGQLDSDDPHQTIVSFLNKSVLKVPDNPKFPLLNAYSKIAQIVKFYKENFSSFALKMYKNYIEYDTSSQDQVAFTNIALTSPITPVYK